MHNELTAFLADRQPYDTKQARWSSDIELDIAFYLDEAIPPAALITSVRAIVLKEDEVLVFRDAQGEHFILPGGRLEEGEALIEALHREIREETRWSIAEPKPIGFIHFHHTTPKPPDYAYPYPDFMQQIYTAQALSFDARATVEDDWVAESFFAPFDALKNYDIAAAELQLLQVAQNNI